MGQSILCPQCEKRFKLSDNPPATATCSGCGTLMDLTAFGGGGAPPPTPPVGAASGAAPPEPGTPKPVKHRASRAGARRRRPPASRRGAARAGPRGRQDGPPAEPPMSGGTQAILIFVGCLILVLVIIVSTKGGDDTPTKTTPVAEEPEPYRGPDTLEPIADPSDASTKRASTNKASDAKKKRTVPLNRKGKPRLSRVELRTHAWPDEVDGAVRAQADQAIQKMYAGGRDGVEAADWFVKQGRPAAGRLISEFRAIEESPGFDKREGAAMAMVIDGTLRRIDGQIERFWEERERIRAWGAFASPQFIERIAKRWTWWWIEGEWKANPRKPWDPFEDESDATPTGMKKKADEPEDPDKSGYGKRAGSGR